MLFNYLLCGLAVRYVIVVYLSDKYAHKKKTESSSARAVKNRVLTDQREKVLCDAVEWQHEFSSGKKSLWHLL